MQQAGVHRWTWVTRRASPRENSDVLKAIMGLCRLPDIPRPYMRRTDDVGKVVAEMGRDTYWMCDLTPGVHCLLALARIRGGRTVCAIVHWDKSVHIVHMPPFKTKLFKGTVLQGVLCRDGLRVTFVVHDCLVYCQKSLLSAPFRDRMDRAREVVGMNFPSTGSYYFHVFIKCVSYITSNDKQNAIKSPNVLFIPDSSTVSDQYVHGGSRWP
eukprot:jgi/Mesvir1/17083/Mv05653-RA.1